MIDKIEKHYKNDINKLANDLNISIQYWYMIKAGKRKPSSKLLYEISKKTRINFEKLYLFFLSNNSTKC